jgi:hypothetical protein
VSTKPGAIHLATLNSYYGLLAQGNHLRLRHQFYHQHVGALKRYFIPANAQYSHLKLRAGWQHLGQPVHKRHSPRI